MEPIVITGLGVLACNGLGRDAFWKALAEGRSGIRRLDRFDASGLPCQIAGQLWDFNPEDFMRKTTVRHWHRHVHQAVAGARLAVEDAELTKAGYDAERMAAGVGTSIGNPNEAWQTQREAYESHGYRQIDRRGSSAFSGHSATVHLTIDFGLRGPAVTIASGCATGLDVLAWGATQLRMNRADAAVVGATESPIFPLSFASACSLGILSKRNDEPDKAMRPFDRNRDGIVLSEAAVSVVMERADRARARGARIYAEVVGFGSAAEGRNPLVLDSKGEALARAVRNALRDSGLEPHDIDHIEGHGVSLEMYDRCETTAYKAALGEHAYRIPISAVKSMTGQAYAAGGLLGAAAALMTLDSGVVPPTVNLDDPDPECDLDFVPNRSRLNDVETALIAAMSFGGTHTAAVLRRMN
ncbi:MAG: beta-ketoacyl-[acyl-carrier-protein] synthase family protein [Candidatus Hydrogenedentes bacterium]|nr:beta-ketoacyl-[acyl-carrier-protein] synthase family protein [Candidatus Hydrogenedentota bacterium]